MRFRVNGASSPSAVEEPSTSAEEVVADSLPLKQPKKRQPHTPTPSQPSNDQSDSVPASAPRVGGFSANTGDEEPGSNNRAVRERDALDDVIEETKATKHLVRLLQQAKITAFADTYSPWTPWKYWRMNRHTTHLTRIPRHHNQIQENLRNRRCFKMTQLQNLGSRSLLACKNMTRP